MMYAGGQGEHDATDRHGRLCAVLLLLLLLLMLLLMLMMMTHLDACPHRTRTCKER